MAAEFVIGVISDTHGLLRPEAVNALTGSSLIVHAGDVGGPDILQKLQGIAPVHAVRGNIDIQPWASGLPLADVVEAQGKLLYVVHDLSTLDLDPPAAGFAAVISGHSHVPASETRNGVLYFNPGSAGPRRFRLPISLGRLRIRQGEVSSEIIRLA